MTNQPCPSVVPTINGQPKARVVNEINIIQFEDGVVSVRGPIRDKVLFYGLLEVARDPRDPKKPAAVDDYP